MEPPLRPTCSVLLETLFGIFRSFGVPLAVDKTEGPCTTLCFLGIELDSMQMECHLPLVKLSDLRRLVQEALVKTKITLRLLQSLLGKLNFACRIIPMGRIFCRRLAQATAGVRQPHYLIRLRREHREDLRVWDTFLEEYNGRSLWMAEGVSNSELQLFTDAAGAVGYGAFFQGHWSVGRWPEVWRVQGLTANLCLLELFPIVVAIELWGREMSNRSICFHCDNMSVVCAKQFISQFAAGYPSFAQASAAVFPLEHLVSGSTCTGGV